MTIPAKREARSDARHWPVPREQKARQSIVVLETWHSPTGCCARRRPFSTSFYRPILFSLWRAPIAFLLSLCLAVRLRLAFFWGLVSVCRPARADPLPHRYEKKKRRKQQKGSLVDAPLATFFRFFFPRTLFSLLRKKKRPRKQEKEKTKNPLALLLFLVAFFDFFLSLRAKKHPPPRQEGQRRRDKRSCPDPCARNRPKMLPLLLALAKKVLAERDRKKRAALRPAGNAVSRGKGVRVRKREEKKKIWRGPQCARRGRARRSEIKRGVSRKKENVDLFIVAPIARVKARPKAEKNRGHDRGIDKQTKGTYRTHTSRQHSKKDTFLCPRKENEKEAQSGLPTLSDKEDKRTIGRERSTKEPSL